jgi:hypothetical protein
VANRAWRVLYCFLLLAVLCVTEVPSSLAVDELTENTWTVLPEQPNRQFCGVAAVDGKIYALFPNTVLVYDPQAGTWTTKYPSVDEPWGDGELQPAPFTTAVVDDRVYFFGTGVYMEGMLNNKVYDTSANHWSSITPDPHSRLAPSACTVNGIIYVIGGGGDEPGTTLVEAYNPSTDTWTTKQPMNKPAGYPKAIAIENRIYVFGGNYIQAYDTITDKWRTIGEYNLDTIYIYGEGATTGKYTPQKIYLFGTEKVLVFDPQTETFDNNFTYPFFSTLGYYQGFKTAGVDDIFYLVGGGASGHMIDYMYVPLGYDSGQQEGSGGFEPFFTVAGIVVAASIVAALGVLVYQHRRKKTTKQT